jgi:hypothetical protein
VCRLGQKPEENVYLEKTKRAMNSSLRGQNGQGKKKLHWSSTSVSSGMMHTKTNGQHLKIMSFGTVVQTLS